MNAKQLILLTALLGAVPGVSFASRLGDAFFDRGGATRKQEDQVYKNPTSPDLDPVAVSYIWDESILTTILEKNPNKELKAVAAYMLGEV